MVYIKTIMIFIALIMSKAASAQIVNVEDLRSNIGDTVGMLERLNLGFSFVKNDNKIFSLNTDFQIEFVEENRLFLSITSLSFLKAGEENFVNMGLQHLRYTYAFRDWFKWEGFGQIQYNEQLRIRLRGLAGTGPRFTIKVWEESNINLGLSYMWEYEELSIDDISEHHHRLSSYFGFLLDFSPLKIASTTYFQPLIVDFRDHRLNNSTSVTVDFSKDWSIKMTFVLNYDSSLPDEVPDLIYSVINSVQYRF